MDDRLLTVREAAKLIRHHPETVRRWARSGKVDAAYIGNKILIPLESLLRLVKPIGVPTDMKTREAGTMDVGDKQ